MYIYTVLTKNIRTNFFQFLFLFSFCFPCWIEMSINTYVFKRALFKYQLRIFFLKLFIFMAKYLYKEICCFLPFSYCNKKKKCFNGLSHKMDSGQEENSKRARAFMFSIILVNFSGKTPIFVVISHLLY